MFRNIAGHIKLPHYENDDFSGTTLQAAQYFINDGLGNGMIAARVLRARRISCVSELRSQYGYHVRSGRRSEPAPVASVLPICGMDTHSRADRQRFSR
jgi:hypothetical protein